MPMTEQDTHLYRSDVKSKGYMLSTKEREKLLKKYLPAPDAIGAAPKSQTEQSPESSRLKHRRRVRPFLLSTLNLLVFLTIQLIFGIYLRIRQIKSAVIQKFIAIRHYHHRTPAYIRQDVKNLSRLPEHLSVLLKYNSSDDGSLEAHLDEVAELAAWTTAAGIPLLSIYEKTGVLKQYMSALQEIVHQKLISYFGAAPNTPTLRVFAPNLPSLSPTASPTIRPQSNGTNGHSGDVTANTQPQHLDLLLLSASDGRDTLVDLTRTLTEMAQSHRLRPKDITADLINAEINATTAIPPPSHLATSVNTPLANGALQREKQTAPSEPDLLIVFAPYVKLDGYPPWQVRLTEIYCVGDSGGDVSGRGSTRVEYQGFLRGLWKYAGAEMRFGR